MNVIAESGLKWCYRLLTGLILRPWAGAQGEIHPTLLRGWPFPSYAPCPVVWKDRRRERERVRQWVIKRDREQDEERWRERERKSKRERVRERKREREGEREREREREREVGMSMHEWGQRKLGDKQEIVPATRFTNTAKVHFPSLAS